jgi:hypothetical protein
VSATSLYALGVRAGYSWWQAAAVPVVADGPAIYGMFRIVSRSRRGAKGAGYGWLLVMCGTAASIGGNVAHAQPNLVAQTIAAAIPLAVLAMLEGLKGDAGEVTRLAARATDLDNATALDRPGELPHGTTVRRTDTTALLDGAGAAAGAADLTRAGSLTQPDQLPHATTVRRTTPTANPDTAAAALGAQRRALPAGPSQSDSTTVGARLQVAYALPRPDGRPWTARTLAEAAGCGRSSAASFLQRQRPPASERTQ